MEGARRGSRITNLLLGLLIGMMLTGTAWASSYLTRATADKLYLNNTKTYVVTDHLLSPSSTNTITMKCPAGWQALGGGLQANDSSAPIIIRDSAPVVAGDNLVAASDGVNPKSTGWRVRASNASGSISYTVAVGVICSK